MDNTEENRQAYRGERLMDLNRDAAVNICPHPLPHNTKSRFRGFMRGFVAVWKQTTSGFEDTLYVVVCM